MKALIKYSSALLTIALLCAPFSTEARSRSGKSKSSVQSHQKKRLSDYEKLFDGKKYKTVEGVLKMHMIEGKLYTEIPVTLLGREFLISTTIEQSSTSDYGTAGWQAGEPYNISFTRSDSMIHMREVARRIVTDTTAQMKSALAKNNVNPIVASYPIKAYNSDSSAVVIENTALFIGNNKKMAAFEPRGMGMLYTSVATAKPDLSIMSDIRAGKDYVSVISQLSYGVLTIYFIFPIHKDRPFTAIATRTITLLPQKLANERVADPRMGVIPVPYLRMENDKAAKVEYFASKIDIGTKDSVRPVIFYVDTLFSAVQQRAITQGVDLWNEAFSRAGFGRVLQTELYPRGVDFDSNTPNGFFIKYAASTNPSIMVSRTTDPRTGQITGARVHIPNNVTDEIRSRRFIDLAASLPEARSALMSPEELSSALSSYVARFTAQAIGLQPNYGAAAAYPTDSLRSATFTQKHGICASITSYNTFNYIASAEDAKKGVVLVNDRLGPYDYLAIEALYGNLEGASIDDQRKSLSGLLTSKAGDPFYYYGDYYYDYYLGDVRIAYTNLGDDPISRMTYRFENLKYFTLNAASWLRDNDPDFSLRQEALESLSYAASEMVSYAAAYIGGTYFQQTVEGDGQVALMPVPKQMQRKVLYHILSILPELSWLDQGELNKGLPVSLAESITNSSLYWLVNKLPSLNRYQTALPGAYTQQEMSDDLLKAIYGKVRQGAKISQMDRQMQMSFAGIVIAQSKVNAKPNESRSFALSTQGCDELLAQRLMMSGKPYVDASEVQSTEAFNDYRRRFAAAPFNEHIFYSMLLQVRDIYRRAVTAAPDGSTRDFYRFMLNTIEQSLKIE